MNRLKTIAVFLVLFGLYGFVGSMEYNDHAAIEQARNNAESE